MQIDEKDLQAIAEYFRNLCKITLLGDERVGKTSLFQRFYSPMEAMHVEYYATIGVDFRTKLVQLPDGVSPTGSTSAKLQVWDTSGAPRFRDIVKSYARVHALIFVFDVTNEASFNAIRDYWTIIADLTEQTARKSILIGNKCDLVGDRCVTKERGVAMARELNMALYLDTSAKDDFCVQEAFAAAALTTFYPT